MQTDLPKMDLSDSPTGCCPVFDPAPWNDRAFRFDDLLFITARTRSLFYIPLNMGKVMTRTQAAIDKAGAADKDRYLMLSEDISKFRAEHHILVTREVPGFKTERLEGRWYARVFEGPFSRTGQWYAELNRTMEEKGKKPDRILAFYTTCPGCAKEYGKNYVVLFGHLPPEQPLA